MGASLVPSASGGPQAFAWELIDLDTGLRRSIATTFYGHGFIQDPRKPRRAFLFEKRRGEGGGACELDLKEGRVVAALPPAPGCTFYGHGAFARDGAVFFASESRVETKAGQITIRDGRSSQILGEFPSYGLSPHDCTLVEGGKVMVIANGGGDLQSPDRPCVTYVEVASRKLLDKVYPTNPRLNTAHLAVSKRGDLMVLSAPREGLVPEDRGGLSWRAAGDGSDQLRSLDVPTTQAMAGETLSLAISEAGRLVGTTNPMAGQLAFWDLDGMALRAALPLEKARGIALSLDGRAFLVTHGRRPALSAFDARTLATLEGYRVKDIGITGSHLYVIPHPD
jgi:hypothetical protein